MIAPCSCAHAASRSTGFTVPSEFETTPVATTFTVPLACDRVELLEPQLALVVERDHPESSTRALGDVLPGDEVRVMLELADDDEVARPEPDEAPGVRDEVDPLGGVADEDDLARRGRVHERAHLLARQLQPLGRALGELVHAAVHVRVRRLVELRHRVEHLARLLRARSRVEERERLAVERLLEDREVGAQSSRVESGSRRYGHHRIVPLPPSQPAEVSRRGATAQLRSTLPFVTARSAARRWRSTMPRHRRGARRRARAEPAPTFPEGAPA